MPSLSVSIVCKNSRATIGRTLQSVKGLAAEVVALDSGSTDGTLELLRSSGARVISTEWLGYGKTKQKALDSCTGDWILCLDSDESLEPPLLDSVRRAMAVDDPAVRGYEVNRKVWYAGAFLHHAWQPEWRLRLVRRGAARWGGLDPHDALLLSNPHAPVRLIGDLRHDSISNIAEFLTKQVHYGRVAANSHYAAGGRGSIFRLAFSPTGAVIKQLILKGGVLDGWRGWIAAAAACTATQAKHASLLEMSRVRAAEASDDGSPKP